MSSPFADSKFGFASHIGINYMDHERRRISGELHDNVSSKLTVIRHLLHSQPDSKDEIIDLLDKTMVTIRRISHNLHLPFLDHITLVEAVRDFLHPLHGLLNIELCDLTIVQATIHKQIKLHVYRIVQEVINNILRHAQATSVFILIKITHRQLNLVIRDNGVGFFEQNDNCYGIGMKNIDYRSGKLKANYKFKFSSGGGTCFVLSVPLNNLPRVS